MFDSSDLDLDAYLARIGYDGRVVPDLETLSALALAHPLAIPFENLDPLLRRPVALDPASLQRKLVHGGRGGWCFEHNLLLGTALRAIGFDVAGLAARVLWMAAPGMNSPRSHMVLLVDVDGQHYVVDAGFGGLTLTAPIRLEADVEQQTPHEPFRLVPSPSTAPGPRPATLPGSGDGFVMEARLGAEWKPLYRFDLLRQNRADYEVTNWYLSNHPQSHFVTGLMAARVERTRRYGLRNNDLAVHHLDGRPTERRRLANASELRRALEDLFGILVPEDPDVDAAFTRLIGSTVTQPV